MPRAGLEARFLGRFATSKDVPDGLLEAQDTTSHLCESFQVSLGVIDAQEQNIEQLLNAAIAQLEAIEIFQRESGKKQVSPIPRPSKAILESPAKKLGYVKLCIAFLGNGLTHFMEQTLKLENRVESQTKHIVKVAEFNRSVPILGIINDDIFEDLEDSAPIVDTRNGDPESVASTRPTTPVKSKSVTTPPKVKRTHVNGK